MSGRDKFQLQERLVSVGWQLQDDGTLKAPIFHAVALSTQSFNLQDADTLNDVFEPLMRDAS